ncbi:MAG: hypothetical protein Q8P19_04130, partial [bacterium]|nr:hypothetical protein [bacterium]
RNRSLLVGALVLLGTAVLSAAALLPAHVALQVEKSLAAQQGVTESGAVSLANRQARDERNDVLRAKVLLDKVAPIVSATTSPTEVISAVLALRPSGVRINRVSFVPGKNGMLTIDGVSPGRESTNEYKELLSKTGRFKSVSVPVDALVGTQGGKFTITLSGTL